jgi:hypothetical protein
MLPPIDRNFGLVAKPAQETVTDPAYFGRPIRLQVTDRSPFCRPA